jgi:hypothetical protein
MVWNEYKVSLLSLGDERQRTSHWLSSHLFFTTKLHICIDALIAVFHFFSILSPFYLSFNVIFNFILDHHALLSPPQLRGTCRCCPLKLDSSPARLFGLIHPVSHQTLPAVPCRHVTPN